MTNDPVYDEQLALLKSRTFEAEQRFADSGRQRRRPFVAGLRQGTLPELKRLCRAPALRNVSVPFGAPYEDFYGVWNTGIGQ
jgi:hypothetical protein